MQNLCKIMSLLRRTIEEKKECLKAWFEKVGSFNEPDMLSNYMYNINIDRDLVDWVSDMYMVSAAPPYSIINLN